MIGWLKARLRRRWHGDVRVPDEVLTPGEAAWRRVGSRIIYAEDLIPRWRRLLNNLGLTITLVAGLAVWIVLGSGLVIAVMNWWWGG
jgi:hypothetical protein